MEDSEILSGAARKTPSSFTQPAWRASRNLDDPQGLIGRDQVAAVIGSHLNDEEDIRFRLKGGPVATT